MDRGRTYAKVVVHEVLCRRLHKKAGENTHFEPESDRPDRRRTIIEPHQAEPVTDGHFRFDVASHETPSRAFRMNERGPDLHLSRRRDEGLERLDAREPSGLTLRGGGSRGHQDPAWQRPGTATGRPKPLGVHQNDYSKEPGTASSSSAAMSSARLMSDTSSS